jgi:hypothetical protein
MRLAAGDRAAAGEGAVQDTSLRVVADPAVTGAVHMLVR